MTKVDLSDIYDMLFQNNFFQDNLEVPKLVISEEISSLLRVRKLYKALENDYIPNGFLRTIDPKLVKAIVRLINTYQALDHFLTRFKKVRIVVLCKPGKSSYNNLGTWRLIILLNIISKLIKSLITKRLNRAAKEYKLFSDTQIKTKLGRLTKTVLKLLIV